MSASRKGGCGCRAVIILANGQTAAGPQEATLPAFQPRRDGWETEEGPPAWPWESARQWPVSPPPGRGQREDRPRLSMGRTEVCSLSAVCVQQSSVSCECVSWINSYWSIGRSRGGGGRRDGGYCSQPLCLQRSNAGHTAMHVCALCMGMDMDMGKCGGASISNSGVPIRVFDIVACRHGIMHT